MKNKKEYNYLPKFLNTHEKQDSLMNFYVYYYNSLPEDSLLTKYNLSVLKSYMFDGVMKYLSEKKLYLQKTEIDIDFPDIELIIKKYNDSELSDSEFQEIVGFKVEKENWDVKIERYRKSYLFLPSHIRQFDQFRTVFKDFHDNYSLYNLNENAIDAIRNINYREGCVFAIDYFIWMLSRYGYEIKEKTRKKTTK